MSYTNVSSHTPQEKQSKEAQFTNSIKNESKSDYRQKAMIGVTHLSTGFSLLALLLLETELPETAEPFQVGLLEFISADFWKTSMVALAMFS